ncbi:hypothetical protein ACLM5J_03130 [Nocardioides sp. Bht2]|uniref:pentapeptide repeat-containing protein n=1 Tax=Nocardioides sp. Bht2 TaxID=3392297 RepID=UPI0039B55E5C
MSRADRPRQPAVSPLALGDLTAGDRDDLRARADLEGELFTEFSSPSLSLTGARIDMCRLESIQADALDLGGSRLTEVSWVDLDAPATKAARSQWREVEVSGRIGSLEAYDVDWRGVHFVGCKIGYLNLRNAALLDIRFTDCQITDLDLVEATARRVALSGCRIGQLTVHGGDLSDVDLRGSALESISGIRSLAGITIDSEQLQLWAPLLAAELGIDVVD